mgnify:CR=1 FL=1
MFTFEGYYAYENLKIWPFEKNLHFRIFFNLLENSCDVSLDKMESPYYAVNKTMPKAR